MVNEMSPGYEPAVNLSTSPPSSWLVA